MKDKEIEIIITPDGKFELDLKNFEGKGCSGVSKELEELLGKSIKSDKKNEYYKNNKENNTCKIKNK